MADAIRDRVLQVLGKQAGYEPADLKPIDNLQGDLGLDSLDMEELQMALEDEFGVEMSSRFFRNVRTVGGLIAFVAREV